MTQRYDPKENEPAVTPSEFLQQIKLAGLRPPAILTFAITGACNLSCCHCWVRAGEEASNTHVSLRTYCRLAEDFAAIGGCGVRITGGEPLCHPDFLEILKHTCSLGLKKVILQTNAMLLSDEHVTALRELDFPGLSLQISLDGVTPESHDLVRGKGAYISVLQGIERLVYAGLAAKISIFFTEMRHNLEEIPELLDFAASKRIGSVSTGTLVLCGRASDALQIAPPEAEQYLNLIERYERDTHFRELYKKIGSVAALEWRADDAICKDNCTFIENPYLTFSGRLYPCLLCHTDEFSVTGVFETGLSNAIVEGIPLWSSLHRISGSRSDAIDECRKCPEKSSCAGGCMGRAWGSYGNLMASDDRCAVRRAIINRDRNSVK